MAPVTEIRLDSDAASIRWDDGRVCSYPYRYLRMQCACAACVDEMSGRRVLKVASVPDDIIAVEYVLVGKYAVQFLWSDGHSTGIYPFDSLLKMAEQDRSVRCESAARPGERLVSHD